MNKEYTHIGDVDNGATANQWQRTLGRSPEITKLRGSGSTIVYEYALPHHNEPGSGCHSWKLVVNVILEDHLLNIARQNGSTCAIQHDISPAPLPSSLSILLPSSLPFHPQVMTLPCCAALSLSSQSLHSVANSEPTATKISQQNLLCLYSLPRYGSTPFSTYPNFSTSLCMPPGFS